MPSKSFIQIVPKGVLKRFLMLLPVHFRLYFRLPLTATEKRGLVQSLIQGQRTKKLKSGKKALFWEPGGMPEILERDALIATALRTRGIETQFVICDGGPISCVLRDIFDPTAPKDWPTKCLECHKKCAEQAAIFDINPWGMGSLVQNEKKLEFQKISKSYEIEKIKDFEYRGLKVGLLAMSSMIRYAKGAPIQGMDEIFRSYLFAALLNTEAAFVAIEKYKPDIIYMSHGCYADFGSALLVAQQLGIPTVVWGGAYLPQHQFMRTLPERGTRNYQAPSPSTWNDRKKSPLSAEENERLDRYVNTRYRSKTSIDLNFNPTESADALRQKLNIQNSNPTWCIFSHLSWDNAFDYAPMAFPDPETWILETFNIIKDIKDVNWLIKVHPEEDRSPTKQGTLDLIRKHFSEIPSNIHFIKASEKINTFDLYGILDGAITIYGTAGREMAMLGKPVIVAGEASYSEKGFTYDGLTKDRYFGFLKDAKNIGRLTAEQQKLARQYAYSYFIERQIPVVFLRNQRSVWGNIDFKKLRKLAPGGDPFIEFICEKILDAQDFVMGPELVKLADFYKA